MALPWGDTTVIGQVVSVVQQAGLQYIVVVTGISRQQVETALAEVSVRKVFNPRYQQDNMAYSLQAGLSSLPSGIHSALVVLGDQPQIQVKVVKTLLDAKAGTDAPLLVPSYNMRRGHPWLINRSLWNQVMAIRHPQTLRDLLHQQKDRIEYVLVDSASILSDLDTPSDYARQRPRGVS
jgi:molybdenum cofactor cytidylyltransferase